MDHELSGKLCFLAGDFIYLPKKNMVISFFDTYPVTNFFASILWCCMIDCIKDNLTEILLLDLFVSGVSSLC